MTASASSLASGAQPIGFGGASVGNLRRAISDDDASRAIAHAWDRGVRYFDTAPHYGLGLSELRLGAALASRDRADFVLSTKVGRLLERRAVALPQDDDGFVVPGDLERIWDFSAAGVRRAATESLTRLRVDSFDVLYAHDPDQAYPGAAAESLDSLARLKAEGLVAAVGIGTNSVEGLVDHVEAGRLDIIMLANRWTLLDHVEAAELMETAARRGVAVVAAGVFNSGLLARPRPPADAHYDYQATPAAMMTRAHLIADVCEDHGLDLPTAAIAFPRLQPAVCSVVLGMRSAEDVDANLDRFETEVPAALWRDLVAEGLVEASAIPAAN